MELVAIHEEPRSEKADRSLIGVLKQRGADRVARQPLTPRLALG